MTDSVCERCGGSCVSRERFDQEHRAYLAAEYRYTKIHDWLLAAPDGRINSEAFEFSLRCVPLKAADLNLAKRDE